MINCRFGALWELLGVSNRYKRYVTKQLVHSHFMPMAVSKAPNQHRTSLGIVTTTSWIVHQRVSRETKSECFYTLNPFSQQRICIVSSCLERRPFTRLKQRDLVEGTELQSNLLIPFSDIGPNSQCPVVSPADSTAHHRVATQSTSCQSVPVTTVKLQTVGASQTFDLQ